MKFCVISSKLGEMSKNLKEEIEKKGHQFHFLSYNDLNFAITDNEFRTFNSSGDDLLNNDVYIFRSFSNNLSNILLFARILHQRGKVILDDCLAHDYIHSKLYEAYNLTHENIPYIDSVLFSNKDAAKNYSGDFPVIAKNVAGARGEDLFLVNDRIEYDELLKNERENCKEFMIQKYIPIKYDVRVFVVGGKVLGAIKRFLSDDKLRTNASLGGEAEIYPLSKEVSDLAIKATKAMNYEVAGVDFLFHEEKPYILEVNIAPQWKKFKEVTDTNPANEIINYLIKKNEKNKRQET